MLIIILKLQKILEEFVRTLWTNLDKIKTGNDHKG